MIQKPYKIGSAELHNAIVQGMKKQFDWDDSTANDKFSKLERKYFSVLVPNLAVVVEYPYVDKVYRNSYYRYYSGKAKPVSRDCIRLSFFIDTNPSMVGAPMIHEIWERQYRGFMILRPTELNIVGRNAISPDIYIENDFQICKTEIPASVNGLKVGVEAFPASSQDAETMVCAETAVWATMEYFGNRYAEYTPVRPSHIIKLLKNQSFSRQLPSSGLTSEQICYLLKNMNFQPVLIPVYGEESDYSMISSFVESGIPVVLSITNYVDESYPVEDRVAHAILCIGHERVKEVEVNNVKSFDDNGLSFIDYDSIKKRFVFIDDNCPAYRMDYLETPADSYTKKKWKDCKIRFASYPLYEKILLMPYSVKYMAINFLHFIPGIDDGREITLRTFLASSRSYKDYVCRNNMPEEMREMILNLYLPKFIWVVELSSRKGLLENYAEGLLIFDSTEPKLTNLTPLELMYYNGQAVYKDDSRTLKFAVNVPDNKFNNYQKNLR